MVFLQQLGLAAHHQTRVTWGKVIVIRTLIVLETLYVEETTVERTFRHLKLTGAAVPTAVQVYD